MRKVKRDSLPEGVNLINEDGSPYEMPRGMKVVMETTEETEREVIKGRYFGRWWREGKREIGKLEAMEIVFWVRIVEYLSYEDNSIRNGEEVMNVTEMAEVTGVSRSKLSGWVDDLIKRRIMGEHSTKILKGYKGRRGKFYTINPFIYCEGKTIPKAIISYYAKGEEIERRKRAKSQ